MRHRIKTMMSNFLVHYRRRCSCLPLSCFLSDITLSSFELGCIASVRFETHDGLRNGQLRRCVAHRFSAGSRIREAFRCERSTCIPCCLSSCTSATFSSWTTMLSSLSLVRFDFVLSAMDSEDLPLNISRVVDPHLYARRGSTWMTVTSFVESCFRISSQLSFGIETYARGVGQKAREGPNTQDKSERPMAATVSLLENMMAGEVAGKSSNTQWAFRQQSKICGVILPQHRLSRVFITVGDPDTTQHPQLTFRFVDHMALISGRTPRHTLCRAWYQEYDAMLREALGQVWPFSFGRDTRPRGVRHGHGSP